MDFEVKINIIILLTTILLEELQKFPDEEISNEINELLGLINDIADKQRSFSVYAELIILQSKLLIIQGNFDEAKNKLEIIQNEAKSKGMGRVIIKIDKEINTLEKYFDSWNKIITSNPDLKKIITKIEHAKYIDYAQEIIRKELNI